MALSPKREGRLTGSVFSAAMGINPYMSRQKLYRQLKGIDPKFEGNDATAYGNANEHNAVDAYEAEIGVICSATGDNQAFIIDFENDWLGVTCDGFVNQVRLVEFKCPFGDMYREAPPHYVAQAMGQMAVTGFTECDLVAWSPDELKIWRIQFSLEYWDVQLQLLKDFWKYMQDDIEPKRRKKPVMPGVEIELLM